MFNENSSKPFFSLTKAKILRNLIAPILLCGFCGLGATGSAMAQDIQPLPNPTPEQAADIQSIINVWSAYGADIDSHNINGVAAISTPIAGYAQQQDIDTMAPSACGPHPGVATAATCINNGGCISMGALGLVSYLTTAGYTNPQVFPKPGHLVSDPVVILSPDSSTAQLYIYFSNGRYVNEFLRTQSGWKTQNIRVTWPNNATYLCGANWTYGTPQSLLADDLYFIHTLSAGPQLSAARAVDPALQRVETYVAAATIQMNTLKYAAVCPIIDNMISEVTNDPALDADSKEFFQVMGTRLLEDGSCDGRVAPDRSSSNGGWAATAYWRAYQLSGNANSLAIPASVTPWSALYVGSNQ